jgi:hypothetical protein
MIETLTNKLNTRQDAYQILKNLYEGISLKQDERDFIKDIQCGDFSVASIDEDGNINGLSRLGYVILVRYKRGQNNVRTT